LSVSKSNVATKSRKVRAGQRRPLVDALDVRLAAAQRFVLGATVVLAGVAIWRPMPDPFMLPKITAILLGSVVLLTIAAARAVRLGRVALPWGAPVWLALALAAGLVLATVTSDNVLLSLVGQHRRYSGLASYLSYLVVFLVAVRLYAGREPRGLMKAVLLSLGVVSVYGLLQVAGLDPYTWASKGLPQRFSTMGNINFAAGYTAMAVPVAAAVALLPGWSQGWRLTGGALLLAGIAYIALNGSSQGPVAAAAGLGLVAAAWLLSRTQGRPAPPTGRRRIVWAACGVLALAAVAAVVVRFGPAALDGFSERQYFWRAALGIFADNPVLGTGMESFRDNFTRYRAPEHAVFKGFDGADSPHDLPLSMLVSGGLPLMLLYLAFVGYVGWVLVRGLLVAPPGRLVGLAAFGGMWLAYQVQSLVSVDVPGVTFLHFLSAALILAAARPPSTVSFRLFSLAPAARGAFLPRGTKTARRAAITALAAVVLLGTASAWVVTRPMRADLAAGQGVRAADAQAKVTAFDRAVALAPWEGEYRIGQGKARLDAGQQDEAYESVLAAAELRRGSSRLALGAADFARRAGDAPTASFWVEQALERDPSNPLLLEEVAALVAADGDTARAERLRQQAEGLRTDHGDY
jgi:O-antigen ligase